MHVDMACYVFVKRRDGRKGEKVRERRREGGRERWGVDSHLKFLAGDHWAHRVNMELENSYQPVAWSHSL